MYWILVGKIFTGTLGLPYWHSFKHRYTFVRGLILKLHAATQIQYQRINTSHENTCWYTPNLYMCFGIEQNYVCIQQRRKNYKDLNIIFVFLMELYQSGPDSKSWEFIVGNSLFHAVYTTLASDIISELGLYRFNIALCMYIYQLYW